VAVIMALIAFTIEVLTEFLDELKWLQAKDVFHDNIGLAFFIVLIF
jgi:hypothetical protein